MIVDTLENAGIYGALGSGLHRAFQLLREGRIATQEDGRYEIDDQKLFCLVQRYTTQPAGERKFESHERYIDVQYVQSGWETIGFAPAHTLTVKIPYNDEKDIVYYETPEHYSSVQVREGMFTIFYPKDAHMPGCQLQAPSQVHKVVVKVRVE